MTKDGITYIAGLLYRNGQEIGHTRNGYIRFAIGVNKVSAHRFIWEMFNGAIPKGMQVDHINSNRSDNRIENLQLLTNKKNQQRKDNGKGWSIKKGKKTRPYVAKKKVDGKSVHLGYFGTPCGAYMANRTHYL